jgi:hypothetical protein
MPQTAADGVTDLESDVMSPQPSVRGGQLIRTYQEATG